MGKDAKLPMSSTQSTAVRNISRETNPYLSKPLDEAARREVVHLLGQMLVSFSPSLDQSVLAVWAETIGGTDDLSIEAIRETARMFKQGLVPDRNNRFPPTTAEFCEQARATGLEQCEDEAASYPPRIIGYLRNAAMFDDDPDVSKAWYDKAIQAIKEISQ